MLISKQRRLRHFKLNTVASLVVIFFVQLKTDEIALSRMAAMAVVLFTIVFINSSNPCFELFY